MVSTSWSEPSPTYFSPHQSCLPGASTRTHTHTHNHHCHTMPSPMPAIYIHAAAFDPAASSVPSAPGKILARRLGLARKTKKVASAPVPAPVPRTMAGLKLDYALLSLEVAQDRRRELPCGAFDIGCALVSLDVAQGRKEISHCVLRL